MNFVIRPGSGGFLELELFKPEYDDEGEPPSIMLSVTAAQPSREHFAMSPEAAKALALALLEQVDAYENWQASR